MDTCSGYLFIMPPKEVSPFGSRIFSSGSFQFRKGTNTKICGWQAMENQYNYFSFLEASSANVDSFRADLFTASSSTIPRKLGILTRQSRVAKGEFAPRSPSKDSIVESREGFGAYFPYHSEISRISSIWATP